IETALNIGASVIPGGSFVKKTLKKGVKYALKGAKFGVGATKDFLAGGNFDFDGLSADIGDLKNGLAGAKAQIENQSKELHGKIDKKLN
ncbi:169_t:CDS:1, partial [Ambispora leptoticha]